MTSDDLLHILQGSIAPCVLISGAGLLLLSMSNRLARPIDRIRLLCGQIKAHPERDHQRNHQQIHILYKRCQLIQKAIAWLTFSIIVVAGIILQLFLTFFFGLVLAFWVSLCFVISVLSLGISLLYFLYDIWLSLDSLKIEIHDSEVTV